MSEKTSETRSSLGGDQFARSKILRRELPETLREEPIYVPARMINEVLYCERLMYLEWVQGEFAHNRFTVDGTAVHRNVDKESSGLAASEELPEEGAAQSVWLSSERLGITAKIDLVEIVGDEVLVIEYKRGKAPKVKEGAYLPERAQLAAQVLLLKEHGYRVKGAAIYYAEQRQRIPIEVDEALFDVARGAAARAKELWRNGELPPPLDDSPKCFGCSLIGICLPDETGYLRRESQPSDGIRRLHPARDDKLPVYVQEAGARIGVSGELLHITSRAGERTEVKIPLTSEVSVFGPVQMSMQAIHRLLEREIPLMLFSSGGWYRGRIVGAESKNVELRLAQYARFNDETFATKLASGFVTSKILNARTMLRRNHSEPDETALKELKRLARSATECSSKERLLGIEGAAARLYFSNFAGMLKKQDEELPFRFDGRNRRPPRDPVNALLSFVYAILVKDMNIACMRAGLDPLIGFYHRPRFGRPSLALDLMEEFRPIVADSTVIQLINNGIVGPDDFLVTASSVAIKGPARRKVVLAYEQRLDQLITHPVFGYRINYRRVFEVQARLLSRHILGEIDSYPQFRTR